MKSLNGVFVLETANEADLKESDNELRSDFPITVVPLLKLRQLTHSVPLQHSKAALWTPTEPLSFTIVHVKL